MANFGAAGSGALNYGLKGAAIGSAVPIIGTAIGGAAGAIGGFIGGLFKKKGYNPEEHAKAAANGGYFTVPPGGYPGHPEWKPGTRQWIPAGSPAPGAGGTGGDTGATNGASPVNYDAIRERSIAPSRGVYQNAMRNLQRQPGMGINQPGYGAQMTALSRGMSNQMSTAATGAEADIGQLRLQELGGNRDYDIQRQQLDVERKKVPSQLNQGLSTTSNILNTIGQGIGVIKGMNA